MLFLDRAGQIEVDGIVVTIASLETPRGEGTEGIALEVARLLREEVSTVYLGIVPTLLVL